MYHYHGTWALGNSRIRPPVVPTLTSHASRAAYVRFLVAQPRILRQNRHAGDWVASRLTVRAQPVKYVVVRQVDKQLRVCHQCYTLHNVVWRKRSRVAFTQGYALIIAVDVYQHHPHWNIPIAARDAFAVQAVLADPAWCGYPPEQITVLTGTAASCAGVTAALARYVALPSDATLLIYYVGHGAYSRDDTFVLTTHDTRRDTPGRVLATSGITTDDLFDQLRVLPAQQKVLLINACHAGELLPVLDVDVETLGKPLPALAATQLAGSGTAVITACSDDQVAYIGDGQLTVFATVLRAALDSRSGRAEEVLGLFALYETLYQEVPRAVTQLAHRRPDYPTQTPMLTVIRGVGPFPVAGRGPRAQVPLGVDFPVSRAPVQVVDPTPDNSFFPYGPIPEGKSLFGRDAALAELVRLLDTETPTSVNIVGARNMGKTSLLNQLCATDGPLRRATRPRRQILVARLDLRSAEVPDQGRFFAAALRQWDAARGATPVAREQTVADNQFGERLAALAPRYTPVLVVDNLDRLLHETAKSRYAFPAFFDGLYVLMEKQQLVISATTCDRLLDLCAERSDRLTSVFYKPFRMVRLDLLDDVAATALLLQGGTPLENHDVRIGQQWAGGNPYQLQHAGAALLRARREGQPLAVAERWYREAVPPASVRADTGERRSGTTTSAPGAVPRRNPLIAAVSWLADTIGRLQALGVLVLIGCMVVLLAIGLMTFDEAGCWLRGLFALAC